jgi:hypothetical protein
MSALPKPHHRYAVLAGVRAILGVAVVVTLGVLPASPLTAQTGEWSGHVAFENRSFLNNPSFDEQEDGGQGSLVFEPEYYRELRRRGESVTFKLFGRLDSVDSERTHFDIRELYWRKAGRGWELLAGVDKVFWGVTESQHLVDIINQTDLVATPDGEDTLGQPMVKLSLVRGWGVLDLFVLPGFRERMFPGGEGRLRPGLPIADDALYESSAEDEHIDFALRWSHAIGPFDIGLSQFRGTSREPRLLHRDSAGGGSELVPFYDLIDQSGLDLQATLSSWLLKLEAINRSGQGERFAAATTGFEYTFYGVLGSKIDLGAVVEYLWDERGVGGSSPFEDDLFVGARLGFNDTQSTEVLTGTIRDLDSDAALFLIEASRRLGDSWTVEAEIRAFSGAPPTDPLASLRADDYVQLGVSRHF